MKKKRLSNKLQVILVILVILLIIVGSTVLVIGSIYGMAFLVDKLTGASDGYLSTGLAFSILCGIGVIILPTLILFTMTKRKQRLSDIKRWIKKYPIFFIVLITIILGAESLICIRGYTYFKDIVQGPQKAIMKDAVVEVDHHYRAGSTTYLVGYVDGEKLHLEITRDAKSSVKRREKYKMLWIKYYEGIQEVYDIDIFIK